MYEIVKVENTLKQSAECRSVLPLRRVDTFWISRIHIWNSDHLWSQLTWMASPFIPGGDEAGAFWSKRMSNLIWKGKEKHRMKMKSRASFALEDNLDNEKTCQAMPSVGATTPLVYSFSLLVKSAQMAVPGSDWGVKSRCPFLKPVIPSTFGTFATVSLSSLLNRLLSRSVSIASKTLKRGCFCRCTILVRSFLRQLTAFENPTVYLCRLCCLCCWSNVLLSFHSSVKFWYLKRLLPRVL